MSPDCRPQSEWRLETAPVGLRVRREGDHLTLTLRVARLGQHVDLAPLILTLDESEQLHAGLCFALDGEPPPVNAPECRKTIHYPGGRQQY
ncbi:hypothetical protein ABZ370_40700 [Streptomyces sp. NPDC005962]|uniref:hypothetical protein n=1 Tax=Streptomyces sp. NPDC005962 TaxID=3154466 RepID=UPI0033D407C1